MTRQAAHVSSSLLSLALAASLAAAAGCAGAPKVKASPAAVTPGPRAPLDESVFARDPKGQLTEEAIQTILESPLELDLPARVGVLPVIPAEDWRGPGPDYAMAPAGLSEFADALPSDEAFTLVTEMMPIPSGALGMEALREIAARYKLRYIVLYREHVHRRVRVNPWAIGYATVVGALFLPGSTLHLDGYVEASLFDVKTGLLLFTARRRVSASKKSNVWHREDKLGRLQQTLAVKVGTKLAGDVRGSLFRYAEAVRVENERLAASEPDPAPARGGEDRGEEPDAPTAMAE